jgi:hypothetical protein
MGRHNYTGAILQKVHYVKYEYKWDFIANYSIYIYKQQLM